MKSTVDAGSNIAFIKYWGLRREPSGSRVPLNPSVSMTLEGARTTTTVAFEPGLDADRCLLNGREASPEASERIRGVLDRVRERAGLKAFARVASRNRFPTSAGVASSASGFAALAVAAARAAGLPGDRHELLALAVLGSGSASRSLHGGYVLWSPAGPERDDTTVEQLAGEDHWPLLDLVAIVSRQEKAVASAEGHRLAHTSPLLEGRLAAARALVDPCRRAIRERDLSTLGAAMEADALAMHAVMMTSRPPLLYWAPATLSVIGTVRALRSDEGRSCYFTIDAGPNVHVITPPGDADRVERALRDTAGVLEVLRCSTGSGPRVSDEHLF